MTDNVERQIRKHMENEVHGRILEKVIEPVRQRIFAAFPNVSQIVKLSESVYYGAYWPLQHVSASIFYRVRSMTPKDSGYQQDSGGPI